MSLEVQKMSDTNKPKLPRADEGHGHAAKHEPEGQLLGQQPDGARVPQPEIRTTELLAIRNQRPGKIECHRLPGFL